MKYLYIIFILFVCASGMAQTYTLSGYVTDKETSEPIFNALVYDKTTNTGTYTNEYGFYSLSVSQQELKLTVSYIGYHSVEEQIVITDKSLKKDYRLEIAEMDAVEISAGRNSILKNKTGNIELNIKEIELMPVAGIQSDIIKAIQTLPGVSSGNEGMSALIVRGGSADQNLVMLDGIPLYHYNHLEGLVSAISTEAISNIKLIKSGFPAKYGNRLSSVLDIRLKNGNLNRYKGNINLGLITSGISLEGPIRKKKSSFIISARGFTLKPWLVNAPYITKDYFFHGYGFNDVFVKMNHIIGEKDRLFVSLYYGNDNRINSPLYNSQKFENTWGNRLAGIHWNRKWNHKLFSNLTWYLSNHGTTFRSSYYADDDESVTEFWSESTNQLTDIALKWDFEYKISSKADMDFGVKIGQKLFKPNSLDSKSVLIYPDYIPPVLHGNSGAVYLNANYVLNKNLSFSAGLRANIFHTPEKTFIQPEPRAVLSYNINEHHSLKASYSIMHQNFHSLSVSNLNIKNNYFIPASELLPPQEAIQYSAGYYSQAKNYYFSLEAFRKTYSNLAELKENVILSDINQSWEEKAAGNGTGESKGIEAFVKLQYNRMSAGISYSLSKTTRQFEEINNGNAYIFDFDRTHDLNVFLNGKMGGKWTYNISWYYMTGQPFTLATEHIPLAWGYAGAYVSPHRNNIRMPDYHRMDIYFERKVIKGKKLKTERKLKLGVYNLYYQDNPQYYYWSYMSYDGGPVEVSLKSESYFPIIPFVAYCIEFK